MNFTEKQKLAHTDDTGLAACAIRLRAARKVVGLSSKEMARACGVSRTVYSNAESGATYPNRAVMKHLYRAHRIDFNFMINGDFAQLPGDVQDAIFPALELAQCEWDRKEHLDRVTRSGRASPA